MDEVFNYRFPCGEVHPAYRRKNVHGTPGGIVAATATVHHSARISESAVIGAYAEVQKLAVIESGVYVGSYAVVMRHARVLEQSKIGPRTRIGDFAIVGRETSIGPNATIGHETVIPPMARISWGVTLGKDDWWITVGPQGSRRAMLTAVQSIGGLRWWVGCKHDVSTDELKLLVEETHSDSYHGDDYRAVISFVENHPRRKLWLKMYEGVVK